MNNAIEHQFGAESKLAAQGHVDLQVAYLLASLALANWIDAHDFGLRGLVALGVRGRLTFGAGRTEAEVPTWEDWGQAMRVSRGNAAATVSGLKRKRVIEETGDGSSGVYGFFMPLGEWKVAQRTERIDTIVRLLDLGWPDVRSALRATYVDGFRGLMPAGGLPAALMAERALLRGSPLKPASTGVPDSGTPVMYPNRVHDANPSSGGVSVDVPESGTSSRMQDLQPCSLDLSKEQACKDARLQECAAVPESGTPEGSRPHPDPLPREREEQPARGRLDGERQDIFDRLRAEGALGPGEESLPNWLEFVRRRPRVALELLGDLRYARTTRHIRNPGAWMMDRWIRWGRPDK